MRRSALNKRTEIWASLRECLRVGAIPDDMELRIDLAGVEYGYIAIHLPIKQVVEAIRLVSAGENYVPSSILSLSTQRSAAQSCPDGKETIARRNFSPRQMEVLRRLRQGKQNKTIAYGP